METNIEFQINRLKEEHKAFSDLKDYQLFTILCIQYYYYLESGSPFDPYHVKKALTDGASDGGIDAIFNDPSSENNDIVIVQSKFYNKTAVKESTVYTEFHKIVETLNNLSKNKVSQYSEKMVSGYRNAMNEMENDGKIKIVFFTSDNPKKKERNKIHKSIEKDFAKNEFDIFYEDEIKTQIDIIDNGKTFVDFDTLRIDDANNFLAYEDSVIVNISAQSLQELSQRRGNALFGMNLRYHIKGPIVDNGIKNTIENDSSNFWYKNNGIIIICNRFTIDGKEIKLENFSIINGGQTTYKIQNADIENDFYIQCKVIISKGDNDEEKHEFSNEIAEATNTQKPIKNSDLKANSYEQKQLKIRLKNEGVFYAQKKGEIAPKQFALQYEKTNLESVGKLGLAGILFMPGSARSNSKRMYQDDYYYPIFESSAKLIKDLLKLDYYYEIYKKSSCIKELNNEYQPIALNGKTFSIAVISLLCHVINGKISFNEIENNDDIELTKKSIKKIGRVEKIFARNIDDEENKIMYLFKYITSDILWSCFETASDVAKEKGTSIVVSDYLKQDNNFYKHVIKKMFLRYKMNSDFKDCFDSMFKNNV